MADPAFRVDRLDRDDGAVELRIAGRLRLQDATAFRRELRRGAEGARAVVFDLARVEAIDGGAMALLLELRAEVERRGASATVAGASPRVQALADLHDARSRTPSLHGPPRRIGILDQIGRQSLAFVAGTRDVFAYLGDVVIALGGALRRPGSVNWRAVGKLADRTGADGLPIVVLISLLMGLILGFQAAIQLKQFGANIYVADLVGLSLTREIGPLMTAIIVAGRSGAAFAAELGTMVVSEEVDALRTLGLSPYGFLVFPRIAALLVALPLLTLTGDLVGLAGGLVVGITGLDLTVSGYLGETQRALGPWDVFSGVLKSGVFAIAIGLIACQRGLATTGGAEGVGRSTTSSVVTILFHLVMIDFAFTILFRAFGV